MNNVAIFYALFDPFIILVCAKTPLLAFFGDFFLMSSIQTYCRGRKQKTSEKEGGWYPYYGKIIWRSIQWVFPTHSFTWNTPSLSIRLHCIGFYPSSNLQCGLKKLILFKKYHDWLIWSPIELAHFEIPLPMLVVFDSCEKGSKGKMKWHQPCWRPNSFHFAKIIFSSSVSCEFLGSQNKMPKIRRMN